MFSSLNRVGAELRRLENEHRGVNFMFWSALSKLPDYDSHFFFLFKANTNAENQEQLVQPIELLL